MIFSFINPHRPPSLSSGVRCISHPLEYTTPGDSFFRAPNVITGGWLQPWCIRHRVISFSRATNVHHRGLVCVAHRRIGYAATDCASHFWHFYRCFTFQQYVHTDGPEDTHNSRTSANSNPLCVDHALTIAYQVGILIVVEVSWLLYRRMDCCIGIWIVVWMSWL